MSLGKSLYKGAVWNTVSQFGTQAINFITIIILARLLDPKEFGLVGMVSVVTSFLGYFTEFGLLPSLIQKKEIDELDCNTVYWSAIFFTVVLYITVYLAAPLMGMFYRDERLILITRILFINFLVTPLSFIPEILEVKKLKYNKITFANLLGAFLSGIIGIVMALSHFGIWSLVWQQISLTFFRGIVLTFTVGWWPRFRFSILRFKQLFNFGLHYTFRNTVLYLSENTDYLLVGKLLGPAALGIYTLAFRMSKYVFLKLWGVFGKMLFPAFSSFSDDLERIRKNYIKASVAGGLVLVPVFIGLLFGLEALVPLIFGAKWAPTIPIVKIFITYLLAASFSYADDSLMIALNELKVLNATKAGVACALLVLGYWWTKRYGLGGMAWAFTISSLAYIVIVKVMVLRRIKMKIGSYSAYLRSVWVMTVLLLAVGAAFRMLCGSLIQNPFLFLMGEGAILSFMFMIVLITNGVIDVRSRRLNLDTIYWGER